ncbi:hypothetical protein TNIN_185271 [Trichonephila inaurata madagascariensis]|uniref:Uncharacterized protein n=1 Tax=Trichonephila inaurata madagascariensis TaxID=2747483 RepID=A0A8X6ME98_9ARAC|nr:hypothetical protein TNIN_185271 [Trichonephila inaurata madagascariensis]
MEEQVDDQCVNMEDNDPPYQHLLMNNVPYAGSDEKARRGALHAGGKDKDPGRVSSNTSSRKETEPESFGNSPDTHNTKLNSTGFKTPLKEKLTSTDHRYGRITLLLWTLKMASFEKLQKRSEGRPPRFQPLMAQTVLLSATHTKQN